MAFGPTVNVVTGATQGIGRAIAEMIASQQPEIPLFLVGRNPTRGLQAQKDIERKTSATAVHFESCDLSLYSDVVDFQGKIARQLNEDFRIGILVNCAAECPQQQVMVQRPTTDGVMDNLDKQFASNVLGYHFMLSVFEMNFSKDTHVVNVASNWAGDLDLNDLHFQQRSYDNDSAYRQSKQCNRMLTALWSEKLKQKGVKINSCHPGDPCTTLSKALGYNLFASLPTARMIESSTPIPFLCGLKGDLTITGGWFDGDYKPCDCRYMKMKEKSQQLFDICNRYCAHSSKTLKNNL